MNNRIVTTNASLEGIRSYWKDHKERHFTTAHGFLTPFFVKEMLPGDTISVNMAESIRMNPLIAPVMGDIYADIYYFFVPYRIIWNKAKQLFGENDVSAWTLQTEEEFPYFKLASEDPANVVGNLRLFLGNAGNLYNGVNHYLPLGNYLYGQPDFTNMVGSGDPDDLVHQFANVHLNSLPLRAYCAIFNDWFRNENVTDPILFSKESGEEDLDIFIDYWYDNMVLDEDDDFDNNSLYPFRVNRFHDVYRSVLPQAQKGDPVTLSLVGEAPLTTGDPYSLGNAKNPFWLGSLVDSMDSSVGSPLIDFGGTIVDGVITQQPELRTYSESNRSEERTDTLAVKSTNIYANLSNLAMITINELRYKFAVQRYLERLARGGSRYQEYVKSMFNVTPNSAVLQVPEYLCGHRVRLQITQITATASTKVDTAITPLGQVAGYSLTNDKEIGMFTKSFSEHGLLIGVTCFRTPTVYANTINPFALKEELFDLYVPPFANIGEVPVDKVLAVFNARYLGKKQPLGFQEAWFDYRYEVDEVIGAVNPSVTGIPYYTFARYYDEVGLNNAFVLEDRAPVLRASAIQGYAFDYICSYYIDYTIARKMPVHSVPGLIDHF